MPSIADPADDGGATTDHPFILHITSIDAWHAAGPGSAAYSDPSLDDEGFIHCSTVDQFLTPANERFAGRDDLVLLVVDTERLDVELVYEDCYRSGTRFPHVYGPIPRAAVVDVVDLPVGADGIFTEPAQLRSRIAARMER